MTRLLTVAHGTRHATGNRIARELTDRAGAVLGVDAVCSYVELSEPLFADVVARSQVAMTVVPLLLSAGYHIRQDLPRMAAGATAPLTLGGPLGPHPMLARVQADRLVEAGARPGTGRLVLVAAGSSDPSASADLDLAGRLLARAWGVERAEVATLSGLGRRPAEVVGRHDLVSPYLLSPGSFAEKLRRDCLAAGADVVADVIGVHPLVVDLLVQRAIVCRSTAPDGRRPVLQPARRPAHQPGVGAGGGRQVLRRNPVAPGGSRP